MTMIDRDVTPACGCPDGECHEASAKGCYFGEALREAIGRLEARDSSVTKPRASCTYEPKHRADVAPAVVQCCGEVIACPTCGEPIT